MGMKVAAVSLMCQDPRVFAAMEMAGTPCPFEGKIGEQAAVAWAAHVEERPDYDDYAKKIEGREAKVVAAEREVARAEKNVKDEWIKECKKTRHPEGTILRGKDVSNIHKSGGTCRKEWDSLNG